MQENPFDKLRHLQAMRAQCHQMIKNVSKEIEMIDRQIAGVKAQIDKLPPQTRRSGLRALPGGAVWTGVAGAAGTIWGAIRRKPGRTVVLTGAAVALVLIPSTQFPFGPRQPPQPVPQPLQSENHKYEHGRYPQPEPAPVVALPPPPQGGAAPAEPPVDGGDDTTPTLPPETEPPPTETAPESACLADVRLPDIRVKLLCRRA